MTPLELAQQALAEDESNLGEAPREDQLNLISRVLCREPVLAQAIVDLTTERDELLDARDHWGNLAQERYDVIEELRAELASMTAKRDELRILPTTFAVVRLTCVVENLTAELTDMTAARDEACDLLGKYALADKYPDVNVELRTRRDALRAVGAKKEETK